MQTDPIHSVGLATGNIILVRNPFRWNHPASYLYTLIRFFANSPWNHCAIVLQDTDGCFIIESIGKGVIKTAYHDWSKRSIREIDIIPVSCHPDLIKMHLGKKYDLSSLLFFCTVKILIHRWLGKKDAAADDKLYCFELAALVHSLPGWWCILPNEFLQRIRTRC